MRQVIEVATVVVQWMHILAALVWVGGQMFGALVVWPALLRAPADRAREIMGLFGRTGAPIMSAAVQLTLGLGLLRGTLLGPMRSLDVLFGSAYGWTFLASILLTVCVMAYGGGTRRAMMSRVWSSDGTWADGSGAWIAGRNRVSLALLAGVIGCMVLMRFGR